MHDFIISLHALVAASIFFVWTVRYANIVQEFRQYGLPEWLRDLVGILKITFALLILIGLWRPQCAAIGGAGIAVLMAAAFGTHLRVKNSPAKAMPSIVLFALSAVIAWINFSR